jgi:uncharacterized membrane protein YfcA
MEIFGWIGALFIGLILGLIGGGGSILTLPVLVYLLGIDTVLATAYSLFVVGTSALVGGIQSYRKGKVDMKTAVVFAIPAFIAVYLTRAFIVPAIPDVVLNTNGFVLEKNTAIMLLFALVMLLAAISMLRNKKKKEETEEKQQFNYPLILLEGVFVGVLTGVVGAGGGFLIIPALVLFAKLPMKKAVGTSLLIIAAKSLIGFIGDVQQYDVDWAFLGFFTAISIIGIFVGGWLTQFISGAKLKKGFAWFVLIMAIYIIFKEL